MRGLRGPRGRTGGNGDEGAIGPMGGMIYPVGGIAAWDAVNPRWYRMGAAGGQNPVSSVNITAVANAIPFMVGRDCTVDGLGLSCTASSASKLARIGIYGSLASLAPGSLLGQTSDLDLGTTGVKIEVGLSIELLAGELYWAAVRANASGGTVRGIQSEEIWAGSPLGFSQSDFNATQTGVIQSNTMGAYGALPASFGSPTGTSATTIPALFARFSA